MSLQSARFAGDAELEACLNGANKLKLGSTGPAVAKIQRALIDLGHLLARFGADGKFGSETAAAVRGFQNSKSLRPIDAVIGAQTMRALDGALPPRP